MKVARTTVVKLLEDAGIKYTRKGKPVSHEVLLEILRENIDAMMSEDGTTDNTALAALSTAFDEEDEVVITGDDPTVPRQAKKAEKPEKKSKKVVEEEEDDDDDDEEEEAPAKPAKADKKADKKAAKASKAAKPSDDDDDDEEAPAKPAKADKKAAKSEKKAAKPEKKAAAVRDKWNSSPESSAGKINAVLLGHKGKGLTIDEILEKLSDDSITRSRIRDHLRRIHLVDGFVEKDSKDRYKSTGKVYGEDKE